MFYQYSHLGNSEYFCKVHVKDHGFLAHLHRSLECVIVLSGTQTVNIGKEKYVLNPNDAIMIFPDQPHSLEDMPNEHIALIFSPDIISAYYSSLNGAIPITPCFTVPSALLEQLKLLEEHSSVIKKKALLYALCDLLDEHTQYVKKEIGETNLLANIFDFVENNFHLDCSLERVSRTLGYSSSYISRYFKAFTDMTYISFVNQYRIDKACYMLVNTNKTILECSLDCGYSSLRNFSRNFKTHVGITPKEYRESRKRMSM
ncbi:MAG: helix-turn-helix domain-containing protein [Clostridia bacterium]|nr:helix-turn-helix domain-containing protein [Clostridia bacterium]